MRSIYHVQQCTRGWRNFRKNRCNIRDEHRSEHPVLIATKLTEQQVEDFIQTHRRVTTDSMAMAVACLRGLAYRIIRDHLNLLKMCAL